MPSPASEQAVPSPRPGMGAVPFDGGTTFRVWAPNAQAVFVTGTFDDWASTATQLAADGDATTGTFSADVAGATAGAEYRFIIRTAEGDLSRMDPYARQVTNSVGNAVVYDAAAFDWGQHDFNMPGWEDVVIYEVHIGTFAAESGGRGDFDQAIERLPHLRDLGISAVQIMPPFEFAGDVSWGYNPAHLSAIETGYGGPDAFKRFIKAAHEHGIAVIVDVVYNHLGPSDLDLWRFDGWSDEAAAGGIYFYGGDRALTPWGATRPDYGRGEVRTFLRDSAFVWLDEYRVDGLRFDSTLYVRTVDGNPDEPRSRLADGWSFLAWLNDEIRAHQPWKLTIAEDLQDDPALVRPTSDGGAGFDAQWDAGFIARLRPAIVAADDTLRDLHAVAEAITGEGRGPARSRVIYIESHDDVADGRVRVPEAISPGDAASWWAQKRATLGSAIVLTSPGIPMLFQGQELLEDQWFQDTVSLDWAKARTHEGILRLHRDLIGLRRGGGATRGLMGPSVEILRADDEAKVLVTHRWMDGGPGDDVVVVANFADRTLDDLRIGMPAAGGWRVRFNSDAMTYSPTFGGHDAWDAETDDEPADGRPCSMLVSVGPYSVVILSQEP